MFSAISSKSSLGIPIVDALSVVNPDVVKIIPIELPQPQPKLSSPKASSPPLILEKSDLQTVKFSGKLNPVRDNVSVVEAPTIKQIEESVIGLQNNAGLSSEGINNRSSLDGAGVSGTGEGSLNGTEIYNTSLLEVMPEFPGGMKGWANFLIKNLHYPPMAIENRISGMVIVSFVVEKNGEISNLKVVRGIGGGCDEEAMRVIKKSPFWKPGMQNGRAVRVAYMMPVVFRME